MVYFPNFWDLIDKFKLTCRVKGWRTFEHEDLVDANGRYHHLILTHQVHFETFKRVVANTRQCIREGDLCFIVDVSYVAWISQSAVPEDITDFLVSRPPLLEMVALYDMSQPYEGKKTCLRVNETDSMVFREFENFLMKHGIEIKPLKRTPSLTH